MKKPIKTVEKKLVLVRATIRNLTPEQLDAVGGGWIFCCGTGKSCNRSYDSD